MILAALRHLRATPHGNTLMDIARALGCRDVQECYMEALRPLRGMGLAKCDQHGTWTALDTTRGVVVSSSYGTYPYTRR